ncbi:unnamed protein product, partial [Prorocentrum cordatum]
LFAASRLAPTWASVKSTVAWLHSRQAGTSRSSAALPRSSGGAVLWIDARGHAVPAQWLAHQLPKPAADAGHLSRPRGCPAGRSSGPRTTPPQAARAAPPQTLIPSGRRRERGLTRGDV